MSEQPDEIVVEAGLKIPMRDGTLLDAMLWLARTAVPPSAGASPTCPPLAGTLAGSSFRRIMSSSPNLSADEPCEGEGSTAGGER